MKNGDYMKKKYYVVLFGALFISVLLLGFSYAKESGTNQEPFLSQYKDEHFKVVYSKSELSTLDKKGVDISVVNRSNKESIVILSLKRKETESKEKKKIDVYYSINDSEIKKVTNEDIQLGVLKRYGTENDQATYNIKITSKSDEPIYYELSIKKEDRKELTSVIAASPGVYKDESGNTRYYGATANNYFRHENKIYRIVGIFGDKIKLTTGITDEGDYYTSKEKGTFLTLDDYLYSFQTGRIAESNVRNSNSWLRESQFWLGEERDNGAYVASAKLGIYIDSYSRSHNNRYAIEIPSNGYLINGDGTENNPYEVSYGS